MDPADLQARAAGSGRLMPVMFNDDDLNQQQRVKCAFDPSQILNPGKVFPKLHRCAEPGRMQIHCGRLSFPDLPLDTYCSGARFNRTVSTDQLEHGWALPKGAAC